VVFCRCLITTAIVWVQCKIESTLWKCETKSCHSVSYSNLFCTRTEM